jgi:hypothetical protein
MIEGVGMASSRIGTLSSLNRPAGRFLVAQPEFHPRFLFWDICQVRDQRAEMKRNWDDEPPAGCDAPKLDENRKLILLSADTR